jgi:hypothetical protein
MLLGALVLNSYIGTKENTDDEESGDGDCDCDCESDMGYVTRRESEK